MEPLDEVVRLAQVTSSTQRWNDSERSAIVKETNRILADPAFSGSKRCQALLRRLVDHAINGDQHGMKERTLGVEVFGRDPDYDTATDPIVRTTANEIRKRLAQSYQNPNGHHEVKIRLIAGAYLPNFEFVQQEHQSDVQDAAPPDGVLKIEESHAALPSTADHAASVSPGAKRITSWPKWAPVAVILVAVICISVAALYLKTTHSKEYLLWKPLLGSGQPLILCISDAVVAANEVPADGEKRKPNPNASMTDAEDAQKITTWLGEHSEQASLRGSSTVNLRDLRQGPVVLIGAFNPWSQMLLSNLRYSSHSDGATHEEWIQDARDPSNRAWKINMYHSDVDYAIVTRFIAPETGRWMLALGGLQPYGTQVAGDFVTDRAFNSALPKGVAANGNFQIVLKTRVIDGSAGSPEVIAFYTW